MPLAMPGGHVIPVIHWDLLLITLQMITLQIPSKTSVKPRRGRYGCLEHCSVYFEFLSCCLLP